jgi:hypothetical protein
LLHFLEHWHKEPSSQEYYVCYHSWRRQYGYELHWSYIHWSYMYMLIGLHVFSC